MSVSPGFRDYVLEQLGRVAPGVTGRAMFGGLGVYSEGRIFALVDDDVVYFKEVSVRPLAKSRAGG